MTKNTDLGLVDKRGAGGYFLIAPNPKDLKLFKEAKEPKWAEKKKDANAAAIAIAQRTGIAILVVKVIAKVIPWHQHPTWPRPQRAESYDRGTT